MWNLIFLITGAIFIILLMIIFFKKEVLKTKENQFFKYLITLNLCEYFAEILLQIFVRTIGVDAPIVDIFSKLYLITIFAWFSIFSVYTFIICLNQNNKDKYEMNFKKIRNIHLGIIIAGVISFALLPFEKFYEADKMYTHGLAIDVLKFVMGIYMIIWIVLLFKNMREIKNKKYIPIFIILVVLLLNVIIQSIDPSILIASMGATFVCYTMSFTIENPDLRMITELANNRKLTESSIEEKSNLLFQVSQEVKSPLMEITNLSSEIYKSNDKNEIKEKTFKIGNISRDVIGVINNVLDISQMDTQNIKITNNTYDIYKLLKEIIYVTKNKYREEGKNIDFKYSISNTIPTSLYGDSLKVKQVICSLLFNAFANTEEGFIDLDVTHMIKYNLCRLIISITDSGKGLNYDEINDIFNDSKELDEKELAKIDDLDLKLTLVKKVIDLLGGSLLVKSEVNRGTTFTIILNQQIANNNNEIETLIESLSNKKKVLLIDDDYLELEKYSYELKKNSLEVISTMYGYDCIEKLENKEKFDLIIVDDELDKYNALDILKDIKKLKIKNLKIIIMLEKEKEFMKYKFLEDYPFTDYLLKDDYKNEIVRIKDKYL